MRIEGIVGVSKDAETRDITVVTNAGEFTISDAASGALIAALMAMPEKPGQERRAFQPLFPVATRSFVVPHANIRGISFGLAGGYWMDVAIPKQAIPVLLAALHTIESS